MKTLDNIVMLSMDPGSLTAGFSIVSFNPNKKRYTVLETFTGYGKAYLKEMKDIKQIHGDRVTRNFGYGYIFNRLLNEYQPDEVVCEEPHFRFLTAYRALVEQITMFRMHLYQYNPEMPLVIYKGSLVKGTLKVKGNSGDKTLMHKGLMARKDVHYAKHINVAELDEHQVDSIAVAITHIEKNL